MERKSRELNRRTFIGSSVAAGVGLGISPAPLANSTTNRILGANDRIRVGFIGIGNRGSQLMEAFMGFDDVEVAALCDVYQPYLHRDRTMVEPDQLEALGGRIPKMGETFDKRVTRHKDFRQLLDTKDIDAVVIATPDHWHAIQMIEACRAGKDVYVEKPLTATVVEGRKMVEAAKEAKRVVQVGLQRRSSPVYQPLSEQVQKGVIGKISVARAYRISNMYPVGIGKLADTEPPETLDWDAWLGPRAWRPFRKNIHPYRFRWWSDYSSQVGNWGVHYFDAIRWMLGKDAPIAVSAQGGNYVVDDDRTIPDTLEVTFELPGGQILVFGQYEGSGGNAIEKGEIELRGTLGNIYSNPSYESTAGYIIEPSRAGQFQAPEATITASEMKVEQKDPTAAHVRNFLDSVKSRSECHCPIEEGHRSTVFAHLANIALATRARLEWDPVKERFINNEKANELLHYEYRKPWKL